MSLRSALLVPLALSTLAAAAVPRALTAQICLGPPARPGEVAFVGDRHARGVTTSYGGRFQANLGGTVALGAGFSVDTFDDLTQNGFTSRLSVGAPRSVWKISACPTLTTAYSEVTPRGEDGSRGTRLHSVVVGSGLGLGVDVPVAGSVSVGAHARPAVLLVLGEHSRVRSGSGAAEPEGPIQMGFTLGGVLRVDRLFVGVETRRTTLPGASAALLRFGILR